LFGILKILAIFENRNINSLKTIKMGQCPVLGVSFIFVILILVIWELVWKIIALWKAGRNNQLAWFICIAIFNTAGILPIIYLLIQKKKNAVD